MKKSLDTVGAITSRICHDLANPLGAIGNGIELLELSGETSPELQLLRQSFETAGARLRLFRLAFGTATPEQRISGAELSEICDAWAQENRSRTFLNIPNEVSRFEGRLIILLLLCLDATAPYGAEVEITATSTFRIKATGREFRNSQGYWDVLTQRACPSILPAPAIQFAIAAGCLEQMGVSLRFTTSETQFDITVS